MELAKRVWNRSNEDDIFGRSAELAYYFFLALFPALILATATLGLVVRPGNHLHDSLLDYVAVTVPVPVYHLVEKTIDEAALATSGTKLIFGLLGALWSATYGMAAAEDTLNVVFQVKERRPYWKKRLIALVLTVVSSLLALIALLVVLCGDKLASLAGSLLNLAPGAVSAIKLVQLPIPFFFLSLVFAVTYDFAPDLRERRWEWLTPGSLIGIVLWVLASVGLRMYLEYFNNYSKTYGSMGAVIILLTWFYVSGMVLLLGAEINAVIQHAAVQALPNASESLSQPLAGVEPPNDVPASSP